MLFETQVLVKTSHTAKAKKEQTIKIAHGVITWISVLFPTGCHNLVHCTLSHHEHQIAPSTEGMSITGDTKPVEWVEFYESYQPPFELKIKAWGVNCTFPHIITVRVAVLPRKAIVSAALTDVLKLVFSALSPKRFFPSTEKES